MPKRYHAYDPKHGRDARLLSPPRQLLGLVVDDVGDGLRIVQYMREIPRADRWLPWHFGKPVVDRWTHGEQLSHAESIRQGREWNAWIKANPIDSPAGPAPGGVEPVPRRARKHRNPEASLFQPLKEDV
jgi:hypothetical protein